MKISNIKEQSFKSELLELTELFEQDYDALNAMFTEASVDVPFDPFAYVDDIDTDEIDTSDCVLSFQGGGKLKGNKKLDALNPVVFSLPAGYTCPAADICLSMAQRHGKTFKSNGLKIKDMGTVRCFAAQTEVQYKAVRDSRWRNWDLLKQQGGKAGMAKLIEKSLKFHMEGTNTKLVRVHDGGDFYSQDYFDAWMLVAKKMPRILFYAYTKSIKFWVKRKKDIPDNFNLIGSKGGKLDALLSKEEFRQAVIIQDKGEAIEKGLQIDVNDFLAAFGRSDFAMLIHGAQPKGTQNGKDAFANRKIISDASKKLRLSPTKVSKIIDDYIDGIN